MRRHLSLVIIALMVVAAFVLYERLPERIPSHWNVRGEVDGWSSRRFGAFGIPAIAFAIWALTRLLPRIDPRRANYAKFADTYDLLVLSIIVFLGVLHGAILANALGYPVSMDRIVGLGVGALFLVIGNVLPRARPNWFVGIRTPWTLSSDRVWERTHRVGGYAFAAIGLAMIVSTLLAPVAFFPVVIAGSMGTVAFVLIYSYVAWRQEGGRGGAAG